MSVATWAAIIAAGLLLVGGLIVAIMSAIPPISTFELEQQMKADAVQSTGLLGDLFAPSWGLVAANI